MQRTGFLTRLRRDTRGNTLAIVGAAMVPLAAMIGSGVDMSRAYMAKTRLQSACDAAALAARRVMTDDEMNDTVRNEARRFLNFNFPQQLYQTAAFTPAVSRPEAGTVAITVNTTIPTTIMSMFGFESLPLNVSCEASLNFVNTDVMLVLDVTGSMDDSLSGTKKIVSLRDAVMALYDELSPVQTQLEAAGLRLRYGVVPYSTTVNVGSLLRDANTGFLSEHHDYDTRVALYDTPVYVGTAQAPTSETQTYSGDISAGNCTKYGNNQSFTGSSGLPSATSNGANAPDDRITYTYAPLDWGGSTNISGGGNKTCRRTRTATRTTYTPRYKFTRWTYRTASFDTSQLRTGQSVTIASNTGGTVETPGEYTIQQIPTVASNVTTTPSVTALTTTTTTWTSGCIEERDTVSTINSSSGYNIPAQARDLDINLVPADDGTRWRPQWRAVTYNRTSSTSGSQVSEPPCPAQAHRLSAWDRQTMQDYVDALQAVGNTYHDIGMVWGARLISSSGPFGDSPDTFNGMPVNRHIIFMTDGQMQPSASVYSAYGIENLDKRITGETGTGNLTNNHLQRFRMICNAVKGLNVSVWVIAFGTSLTADMRNCASNANQASTSANRDQLIARFRQIGNQIGALRLTQ